MCYVESRGCLSPPSLPLFLSFFYRSSSYFWNSLDAFFQNICTGTSYKYKAQLRILCKHSQNHDVQSVLLGQRHEIFVLPCFSSIHSICFPFSRTKRILQFISKSQRFLQSLGTQRCPHKYYKIKQVWLTRHCPGPRLAFPSVVLDSAQRD